MEASKATASIGNPSCTNTVAIMTIPAPGTPAVPIEASVPMRTTISISVNDSGVPAIFAAKTADTAIRMAAPSILTVAPSGKLNPYRLRGKPKSLAAFKDKGKAPALLCVTKAVVIGVRVCLKNVSGFTLNSSNAII